MSIGCSEHGEFQQKADGHLLGKGCPKCGGSELLTHDEVIRRFRLTHGDLYDYTNVSYVNANTKVEIICTEHGSFHQKAVSHWGGHRCPSCNPTKALNTSVYLLGGRDAVKIGISVTPVARWKHLNYTSPFHLSWLGAWTFPDFKTAYFVEQQLHQLYRNETAGFSDFDGCTEYFKVDPCEVAEILRMLGGIPYAVGKYQNNETPIV